MDSYEWAWLWKWCWENGGELAIPLGVIAVASVKLPALGGVTLNLGFPVLCYPVFLFGQQLQAKLGFMGATFMRWFIGAQLGVPLPVLFAIPFLLAYSIAGGLLAESRLKWLTPLSCAISAWMLFGVLSLPVIYICWRIFRRIVFQPQAAAT